MGDCTTDSVKPEQTLYVLGALAVMASIITLIFSAKRVVSEFARKAKTAKPTAEEAHAAKHHQPPSAATRVDG